MIVYSPLLTSERVPFSLYSYQQHHEQTVILETNYFTEYIVQCYRETDADVTGWPPIMILQEFKHQILSVFSIFWKIDGILVRHIKSFWDRSF